MTNASQWQTQNINVQAFVSRALR